MVTRLLLPTQFSPAMNPVGRGPSNRLLEEAAAQLRAFLARGLTVFDLPLDPRCGTPFQQSVWTELRRVPYGTTTSYSRLAARIGRPHAVRAVGAANARNPIPIIVPCHRVLGSNGALTGYAGGTDLKQRLLDLERRGPQRLGPGPGRPAIV